MHTYISSTVGFKNRGSFSFSDFYSMNEIAVRNYIWGGLPSINGFVMPPKILYSLRQSTLLQWSASRRMILGGDYGNGYYRLATRTASCDCQRDYPICYPAKARRRGRKIACVIWEDDECDSVSWGNAEEIISLMTDIMGSRSRNRNGRLNAEGSKKTDVEHCCHCQSVNGGRIDDHPRREEKHVESGSQGRKLNGEVHIRRGERYRQSRSHEASRDDNRAVRNDGSNSSYYSVLSSGDFVSNTNEGSLSNHGKVRGESSSGCQNRSRSERMDSCKEDVKQIQYYRDDRHYVESSTDKIAATVRESMSRDDRSRLEAAESDTGWGSIESQKGDIQMGSIKENNSKLRIEKTEEHGNNRHYAESSRKRFAAKDSMKQDDEWRSEVVESDSDWHVMKDSKKHTEISEKKSNVQRDSEISEKKSNVQRDSEISDKKSHVQRDSACENLIEMTMKNKGQLSASSATSVHREKWQFSQKDQQIDSQKGSLQFNEISKFHDDNIDTQKQLVTVQFRQENTSSNSNLFEEERMQNRINEQLLGRTESKMKYQNHAEISEIHDINIGRSSNSQKIVTTTTHDRVRNSTLALNVVQGKGDQSGQMDQQSTGLNLLRSTTTMHDRVRNSTLALNLVQGKGDQSGQIDQQTTGRNLLRSHSSDTERLKSSQRVSEISVNDQEGSLTSVVNLVQEDGRKRYQTDEQIIRQRGSRRQFHANVTEAHDSNIGSTSSSSQMLLKTMPKDQAESSVSGLYLGVIQQQTGVLIQDNRSSQVMVVPPQSQLASRGSKLEAENMEDISSNTSAPPEAEKLVSRHELDTGMKMDNMHNDTLGSAHRMESSSAKFVGEFVESLGQVASTSQESSLIPKHASEIRRDLTLFSGTKGPSDEMWDVAGPTSQEPSAAEAPVRGSLTEGSAELTSTEHTVAQRSSRSLWSFIADIVRLRWGARAESHTTHVKTGTQSSSGESLTSDAYFSGHEPENDNDENVGKANKRLPKEQAVTKDSAGQPSLAHLPLMHGSFEVTGSQEERKHTGPDILTSAGEQQRSLSRGASASGKEDGQIKEHKAHLSVATTDPPFLIVDNASSSIAHLEVDTDEGNITEIGTAAERPVTEGGTKASGTQVVEEVASVQRKLLVKQRKLQRNKQVLRERFDEWEEAFKLEQEQRQTDEMFMKEALIEAKKAADIWEVPVGAVLVQNGKIIARGCNLVEELRDSTAHAELICIREASKLLNTWRLAETTLYVTLEPCPMCAGAILQARIDTVVWGAPNKLLGADGSWISLFPGGGEEGRDGPIHPFHPKMTIRRGILATECADIMQQFFQLRRKKNKKPEPQSSRVPTSNLPSKFFSKVHDVFSMMFCL